jgi:hypothetical protein
MCGRNRGRDAQARGTNALCVLGYWVHLLAGTDRLHESAPAGQQNVTRGIERVKQPAYGTLLAMVCGLGLVDAAVPGPRVPGVFNARDASPAPSSAPRWLTLLRRRTLVSARDMARTFHLKVALGTAAAPAAMALAPAARVGAAAHPTGRVVGSSSSPAIVVCSESSSLDPAMDYRNNPRRSLSQQQEG